MRYLCQRQSYTRRPTRIDIHRKGTRPPRGKNARIEDSTDRERSSSELSDISRSWESSVAS